MGVNEAVLMNGHGKGWPDVTAGLERLKQKYFV